MGRIPESIPSAIMDRIEAMLLPMVDMMIQLELEFPKKLDIERIARAMELIQDAEPVLGCRWVHHWWRPRWERLARSERQAFQLVTGKEAYETCKNQSSDLTGGPQIKAFLYQSSDGDRLLLKVSHIAADAAAVKDIVGTLSSTYTRLSREPDYQPEPNIKGSRDIWQILRHIPWHAYPEIYLHFLRENRMIINATHGTYTLPFEDRAHDNLGFVYRFLPAGKVSQMMDYGRSHDATLNDVMLAAYVRALGLRGDWDRLSRLLVLMTVDLRQWYLPTKKAGGICNLSAGEYLDLGTDLGNGFAATLRRVCTLTKARKSNWIGVNQIVGAFPFLLNMPQRFIEWNFRRADERLIERHNLYPGFTNMGEIDMASVTFDEAPSRALLLTPPTYPPHFTAGVSGYAGTLAITAGAYASQRSIVEQFLDDMVAELPS
jgi:NRPS condensation-like uncharacterized protein